MAISSMVRACKSDSWLCESVTCDSVTIWAEGVVEVVCFRPCVLFVCAACERYLWCGCFCCDIVLSKIELYKRNANSFYGSVTILVSVG